MNGHRAPGARFDATLLSRVEDASLNASAPPQQWWLDGWLVRASPGKAKRARCINAVAEGRLPLPQRLAEARALLAAAGLPALLRITPFSLPAGLDAWLAAQGWEPLDDTRVLVCTALPAATARPPAPPAGLQWQPLGAADYAAAVGQLRGSPPGQQQAHAQRIAQSPTPYVGLALVDAAGQVQACGQAAREGRFVGLYDVHTRTEARNQGLAHLLCKRLLTLEARAGAEIAYLQVEADNAAAQAVYRRLGFAEAYGYHYRQAPEPG